MRAAPLPYRIFGHILTIPPRRGKWCRPGIFPDSSEVRKFLFPNTKGGITPLNTSCMQSDSVGWLPIAYECILSIQFSFCLHIGDDVVFYVGLYYLHE